MLLIAVILKLSFCPNLRLCLFPLQTHSTSERDHHFRPRSFSVESPLHCSKMDPLANQSASGKPPAMNASRYKTELCRPFQEYGYCKYGDKCQFAHGMQDLRSLPRHPKYKTELCRTFYSTGYCPYGTRCHFIHTKGEARSQSTRTISPFTTFPQSIRPPLSPSQDSGISSPDENSAQFGATNKIFEFPLSDGSCDSDDTPEVDTTFIFPGYDSWSLKSPIDPTLYLNDMDSHSTCSLSPAKPPSTEEDLSNRLSSISLDEGLFSNPSRSRLPVFDMLNSQSDTVLAAKKDADCSWY